MARILGLLPAALLAASNDMGANAFDRELRNLGLGARRSEVLALYRTAKSIVSRSPDEPYRDPNGTPSGGELGTWPTKNKTGIVQNVTLVYRDRTTGQLNRTYYRYSSEGGVPRSHAMASAIDAYSGTAEQYNQDLVGAVHTSAYRLTPFGV